MKKFNLYFLFLLITSNIFSQKLVKDFNPGPTDSNPKIIKEIENNIIVLTNNGKTHTLWKGEVENTSFVRLKDFTSEIDFSLDFVGDLNSSSFFVTRLDTIFSLWKWDLANSSFILLKDFHTAPTYSWSYEWQDKDDKEYLNPDFFTSLNNKLYFKADDGIHGYEIWETDGTVEGTKLLKDIYPGPVSSSVEKENNVDADKFLSAPLLLFKNDLYFRAEDGVNGYQFWKSDGTAQGTKIFLQTESRKQSPFWWGLKEKYVINDSLLLFVNPLDSIRTTLWRTNGTESGTITINDSVNAVGDYFKIFNSQLYFYGGKENSRASYGLWKSDGTKEGTKLVKPLYYLFNYLGTLNGSFYFYGMPDSSSSLYDLWKSNGTEEGTIKVKTLKLDSPFHKPTYAYQNLKNKLIIEGYSGAEGYLLLSTDGSENGTEIIDENIYNRVNFYGVFDKFYYSKDPVFNAPYLMETDGTKEGTKKSFIMNPNEKSQANNLFQHGDILYFSKFEEATGNELWMISKESLTSTLEKADYSSISISPNPITTFSLVTIPNSSEESNNSISLYNLQGQLINIKTERTKEGFLLHRENLPSGIYFLEVLFNNNKIYRKKIATN